MASIIAALLIIPTVLFLTPVFASLPNAALGATIIVAVINLVDVAEMRHIAKVKRSDLIGLGIAFGATLVFGIERGMLIAIVASMLVVFARMSRPHSATLGRVPDTTSYRNVDRFPAAITEEGISVIRIDAALSFVNAQHVKELCLGEARRVERPPRVLIVDCSGINDIDATGADVLSEIITELDAGPVTLHLCDVKGPVRDVLHRSGLWARLDGRIHATAHQAVEAVVGRSSAPTSLLDAGVDERAAAAVSSNDHDHTTTDHTTTDHTTTDHTTANNTTATTTSSRSHS